LLDEGAKIAVDSGAIDLAFSADVNIVGVRLEDGQKVSCQVASHIFFEACRLLDVGQRLANAIIVGQLFLESIGPNSEIRGDYAVLTQA